VSYQWKGTLRDRDVQSQWVSKNLAQLPVFSRNVMLDQERAKEDFKELRIEGDLKENCST
jgi:hypothetical protein